MAIAVDLILVAIIIVICANSYLKGLVISVFNLVSSILAILVAVVFYPVVSGWLEGTPLLGWIQTPIQESLLEKGAELTTVSAENLIAQLKLPEAISQGILDGLGEVSGTLPEIVQPLSAAVAAFILQVICMIVLFLVVKIGLMFLKGVLETLTKIPVLKQVDKLGGLAFGVIESFVLLTIVGALLSLFSGSVDSGLLEAVNSSYIGRFFYNQNLLIAWLSNKM